MVRFSERFDGSNVMASHINGYTYLLRMMLKDALILTSPPITEELDLDVQASIDYKTGEDLMNIFKTSNPLVTSITDIQVSTDGVNFEDSSPVEIDWLAGRVRFRVEQPQSLNGVSYTHSFDALLNDGETYFSVTTTPVISGTSSDIAIAPVRATVTHWALLVDGVIIDGPVSVEETIRVLDVVVADTSRVSVRLYDSGPRRVRATYTYALDIKIGSGSIDLGTFITKEALAGISADLYIDPTVSGATHWALLIDDVIVDGPMEIDKPIRVLNTALAETDRLSVRLYNSAHLDYMMLTPDIASTYPVGELEGQTVAAFEDAGLYLLECKLHGNIDSATGIGSGTLVKKEVD